MFEEESEFEFMGSLPVFMSGLSYAPDLEAVGSGSAGTYYPRDTSADAAALNYLGFLSDAELGSHVGTNGSQAADVAAGAGAWSIPFQAALTKFQLAAKIGADGWIGPNTRRALAQAVAAKNAGAPDLVVPPLPNVPNVTPTPTQPTAQKSHTGLFLVGGAIAAVGLGYWLLK